MYRIRENVDKTKVACTYCYKQPYHEVKSDCTRCGGKGVHNKGKKRWIVAKEQELILQIDRDENGELRFWESKSCYFPEGNKIVHFTKEDAKIECDRRNAELGVIQTMRQEREETKTENLPLEGYHEKCKCSLCCSSRLEGVF